ncbi:ABC transporter ATP-binding protein [Falsiroseomonas selenitidurans]|uniref:ATP-binding cassette domain-containing protein n=1 Tax=Falsiroseomonas selenitidurans TaxID=2716335 RepID=A0ABX1E7K0_9PROT|nr:oligopeptide/dipeptide ABC transporter ATP-binding protein [Falsiroseomonas selenitidurans]NKC33166.1 ATP-binding cassette domain-containing protein [Falsiroseomonas selenitidurans]
MTPVLQVEDLRKHFPAQGGRIVHAVNGVSFSINPGETLGVVGESGSGKSTIGRAVIRLLKPTAGRVRFQGQDITHLPESACRRLRAEMQMVFQDPWSALNPRIRIGALIAEPLLLHTKLSRAERRDAAEDLAQRVRLTPELLTRFPAELSGGQLQRVCIARAIATRPKLIVLDEPTSSLDLSVRAGILDLLATLKAETGAAMMFISHDLGTVKLISDRIMVLYLGGVVEYAPAAQVFAQPAHPYSQALMSAHLPADPEAVLRRHVLEGEIPSPIALPPGCHFASRCPVAAPACSTMAPELRAVRGEATHQAACLRIAEGANLIPEVTHG